MQIKFVDHQSLIKLADSNLLTVPDCGDLDKIKADVRSAIRLLSQSQQTIIIMYYFEDASIEQIAAETGMSPKQIKKLLSAARTTLKYSLKKAVVERWPAVSQDLPVCPICLNKRRAEIDKLIKAKPDSQSWRSFNQILFKEFGLKINPPILLKYHIEYHQKG
jgi:hypothetical protein